MHLNDPEDDDVLDLDTPIEGDEGADEQASDPADEEAEQAEEEIGFGEEEDDDTAPDLPKRLRAEIKERDRKLAIANKRIAELDKPAVAIEVGPRPTREQFDWDDEAYDKAIDEWNERRFQAQQQAGQPNDLQAEAKQDVERLTAGISSLPYADAQEIVPEAMKALTAEDQFIIASAVKEPGKFMYALAKNPERLTALLDIKNPVKRIAEIARMETQMTTRTRTPVAPEQVRSGDTRPASSSDKTLAQLQKKAEASGDYTAVLAYKRGLREKAA